MGREVAQVDFAEKLQTQCCSSSNGRRDFALGCDQRLTLQGIRRLRHVGDSLLPGDHFILYA